MHGVIQKCTHQYEKKGAAEGAAVGGRRPRLHYTEKTVPEAKMLSRIGHIVQAQAAPYQSFRNKGALHKFALGNVIILICKHKTREELCVPVGAG